MKDEKETLIDENFSLFSRKIKPPKQPPAKNPNPNHPQLLERERETNTNHNPKHNHLSFGDVGLAEWAVETCKELGMKKPSPVQHPCIPRILSGQDVLGLAQTGSGKTAAFALPILHRLAQDPYESLHWSSHPPASSPTSWPTISCLGSCSNLRCAVVVGGMDMINQAQALMQLPHVVIATPGRIKFLVLDEADRVLDVGFEEELRAVFQCLPKNRQTLLFSATMTSDLQTLLELSANKYIFVPKNVKDVYLLHILSKIKNMGIRSAMIFVSICRSCHHLSLLLEELDLEAAALHSFKSQSLKLAALHRFKSGRVPVLLATDVASRGLDIPTVDLVINYDVPRYPRDYAHRVGHTARAGRGGLAVSLVSQNDVDLLHEIEAVLGKQLDKFEYNENEVLADITKVRLLGYTYLIILTVKFTMNYWLLV
ncbi:DEAD-box ATP-dependent RNA helicase 36 [Camellia lanceoleosa]|uniref:DEAD-box ATP-dependent RNA helicase 36 n=1 Tax=Camellia lanceoleosa TaxID=1840588 RepID=A0ACC0I4U3_9ERIC|nr:DEAD-box ATP-dependent RNA helicase 36 [Camellia lanceoleosa]